MRAVFAFDAAAWELPQARRAAEVLASLLDVPARVIGPAERVPADAARVHVGLPAGAPAGAAATLAVEGWPQWNAGTFERVVVAGEPLPCPPGTPASRGGDGHFPAEWLRAAAFALAREEEFQDRRRDTWECYSGTYTRLAAIGLLERPFVNHMALAIGQALEAHAAAVGRTLERLPRWKGGARFAVALTHDVDDVSRDALRPALRLLRQARAPRTYAFRAGLAAVGRALARPPGASDPYWAFERWMGEEERCGFRSTFYICPPAPSRRHEYDAVYTLDDEIGYDGRRLTVAGLLREMRRRGHEVGLHGSYLSHVSADELARQRGQIARGLADQDAVAGPVLGTRQHFLRFDAGATWRAQAHAGFEYDSTLGYNEAVGFRAGVAAPFRPWDPLTGEPHGLWELPLTAMDGTLFRTLKLDAGGAVEAVRRHLDAVAAAHGLGVLLWHPNAADERSFPGWWDAYLGVLDDLSRRDAWVAPAGEIARWWQDRERVGTAETA